VWCLGCAESIEAFEREAIPKMITYLNLFSFLRALDKEHIYYALSRTRDDTVMATITQVGYRVEVDFFEDGHIEYSVFTGDEGVTDDLERLKQILELKHEL